MQKLSRLMLGTLFSAILVSGVATADPILTIQPSPASVAPGGTLNLNVNIVGASDLFAFQFDLSFMSSVLSATTVTEGSFLSGGGNTFFVPGTIGQGNVSSIADTLLGPGPGVSGSGTLASVTVRYNSGTTPVSLANVLLLDSALHPIPFTTMSSTVPSTVPEPGSAALAALALFGVGLCRAWSVRMRKEPEELSHEKAVSRKPAN